jgi:hypothetical protein
MKAHLIFKSASVLAAVMLSWGSAASAAAIPYPDAFSFFKSKTVDPTIPEDFRHSFKTSRNNVVMVFDGTHWHSLSNRAVDGSPQQQRAFCDALTRSDRSQGVIPRGFAYVAGGDGRVYLVKSSYIPPAAEPEVVKKPAASKPVARSREVSRSKPKQLAMAAASGEVVRRAIVTPVKQEPLAPAPMSDGSYRTAMGDVLMKSNGDQWEGHAPTSIRQGLRAPDFCAKAAAMDRLKGRLPADYTYVLLADDTLLAVRREAEIVRAAGIK